MKLSIFSILSIVVCIIFAIGTIFYARINKSERQYVSFSNLLCAFIIFLPPLPVFANYAWYWFLSYPVVFIVLFNLSKKFINLNDIDLRCLTIKEFISRLKKK